MNNERFWRNTSIIFFILLLISVFFIGRGYYYKGQIDTLNQIRQPAVFEVDTTDYEG